MGSEVPEDLIAALSAARRVEDAAGNRQQWTAAVAATGTLLYAAHRAGWRTVDLAGPAGLSRRAAQKRVEVARARHRRRAPAGLDIQPPPRRATFASITSTPLATRQWLSRMEAMQYTGISHQGLRLWQSAGLLPNCYRASGRTLFLRADLDRIRHAPRYNNCGADWSAVRAAIQANGR